MKTRFLLLLTVLYAVHQPLSGELQLPQEVLKEEMTNHIHGIENVFQSVYAPTEWKAAYLDWNLHDRVEKALQKVQNSSPITLKEYQKTLVDFFDSPKDYHTSIQFFSTESATLPFRVRGSQGRYFVAWINPVVEHTCPLSIGDEVLSFAGQPINQAIEAVTTRQRPITETDIELASIFLTARMGTLGHDVPSGTIDIEVQSVATGLIQTVAFAWEYKQEQIKGLMTQGEMPSIAEESEIPTNPHTLMQRFGFHNTMFSPMALNCSKHRAFKVDGAFPIGDKRGPLPFLGAPSSVSSEESVFFSYIFKTGQGKSIGYIRIPHFIVEDPNPIQSKEFRELRTLIAKFQKKTDALVIDLLDNTGGYYHILTQYLSLLCGRPLTALKHQLSITQQDVMESLQVIDWIDLMILETLSESDKTLLTRLRKYFAFVCKEWQEGRYLSKPTYIFGEKEILPDRVSYNKPILVLVNSLDFSCADIFPAILQDNNRAVIFGTKTAGAGGVVRACSVPNHLGIVQFSYTGSLLQRKNKIPLENLGVMPDVYYPVTPEDLQNNYGYYIQTIHRTLRAMQN